MLKEGKTRGKKEQGGGAGRGYGGSDTVTVLPTLLSRGLGRLQATGGKTTTVQGGREQGVGGRG